MKIQKQYEKMNKKIFPFYKIYCVPKIITEF